MAGRVGGWYRIAWLSRHRRASVALPRYDCTPAASTVISIAARTWSAALCFRAIAEGNKLRGISSGV